MEDVICYCAICQGQVPFEDVKTLNAACSPQPLTTDKVYCPHCEMLVEPVTANVTALGNVDPAFRGDVPGDRGRSRREEQTPVGASAVMSRTKAPRSGAATPKKRNVIPGGPSINTLVVIPTGQSNEG